MDVFAVEPFTDYIYLGGMPYAQERIIHHSRIFAAVAQAFLSLKRFYQDLARRDTPEPSRLFPRPTYLASKELQNNLTFSSRFQYDGRSSSDYQRSLFRATYRPKDEGVEKEVLVKFCDRYHGLGHELVAEFGYAPHLFFCERIQGEITMVITEFIDGRDAHYHFMNQGLPSNILNDVKHAVKVLHDAGYVFGDLRRPNIMIHKTADGGERAQLIDFEWVGRDGQAQYPALLNNSGDIKWPVGVKPHATMWKVHDTDMIHKITYA